MYRRDIDVSKRAAEELAMAQSGNIPVTIKLITTPPDVTFGCPQPAADSFLYIGNPYGTAFDCRR
jgi:rare lipoprotein A (peptidoglycan hydrolase)